MQTFLEGKMLHDIGTNSQFGGLYQGLLKGLFILLQRKEKKRELNAL